MIVGKNIKNFRKLNRMTQDELANAIGKSTRMIQKYEYGEVVPSLEVINDLANALDISPDDLIKDEESSRRVRLLKILIEGTYLRLMKWEKGNLELEGYCDNKQIGNDHKVDIKKLLFYGLDDMDSAKEEPDSIFYFGKIFGDQFYLSKVNGKEKYILYHSHLGDNRSDSFLIMLGTSEEYPDIKRLYKDAKSNYEGKFSFWDSFENGMNKNKSED